KGLGRGYRNDREATGASAGFQSCREATMPERRAAGRRVAGILGCAAVLAAAIIGIRYGFFGAKRGEPGSGARASAGIDERSPLADVSEAARNSNPLALAE